MGKHKENFAIEILSRIKRERNFWMAVAIISIVFNLIQWIF